jgi:hypothetical protein
MNTITTSSTAGEAKAATRGRPGLGYTCSP